MTGDVVGATESGLGSRRSLRLRLWHTRSGSRGVFGEKGPLQRSQDQGQNGGNNRDRRRVTSNPSKWRFDTTVDLCIILPSPFPSSLTWTEGGTITERKKEKSVYVYTPILSPTLLSLLTRLRCPWDSVRSRQKCLLDPGTEGGRSSCAWWSLRRPETLTGSSWSGRPTSPL